MRRHRTLLLAAILVVCGGSVAAAQDRQLGLKAGASVAMLHPEIDETPGEPLEPRAGFTGGVFVLLPFHALFGVQLEALFTDKGGSQPIPDARIVSGVLLDRVRLHYLDFPALLRISGPRAGMARLHAFAGPTLSVRLHARYEEAFSSRGSAGIAEDIGRDTQRFDAGLTLGGGAELGERLVLDGRYTHGFTEVLDEDVAIPVSNRGFLLTIGVRIF